MTDEKSSHLVPTLRFPEFREAGEWEIRKLGELIEIKGRIGYRGYTVEDIVGEGNGAISLSPSNISDTGELSFSKSTYISWDKYEESPEIMLKEGFTVLVKTGSSYGKVALIQKLPIESTINPQLVIFKPIKISSVFLFLTVSNLSIQKQIRKNVVGGAIPTLSQENISKFSIFIPSQREQQKIAACLSSLDELITAHSKKLDALKNHKKGLMQQLFPAEGQTVPILRFPEFSEAGEWVEKSLGEIAEFYKGKGISKADISNDGKTPCVRYGELYTHYTEIINSIFSKTNLSKDKLFLGYENDVIIPSSGETKLDIATASCLMLDGVALGGDINIIRCNQNGIFMSYYLNSTKKFEIAKVAQGDTVVHLYSSQLKKLYVTLPTLPEQQKIAACLSSLDELITAHSKKLDALKKHKKGLMQQLFPAVGEE